MEGLNSGESAGIALGPVLLRLGLLSFSVEAIIVEANCVLKMKKKYSIIFQPNTTQLCKSKWLITPSIDSIIW